MLVTDWPCFERYVLFIMFCCFFRMIANFEDIAMNFSKNLHSNPFWNGRISHACTHLGALHYSTKHGPSLWHTISGIYKVVHVIWSCHCTSCMHITFIASEWLHATPLPENDPLNIPSIYCTSSVNIPCLVCVVVPGVAIFNGLKYLICCELLLESSVI